MIHNSIVVSHDSGLTKIFLHPADVFCCEPAYELVFIRWSEQRTNKQRAPAVEWRVDLTRAGQSAVARAKRLVKLWANYPGFNPRFKRAWYAKALRDCRRYGHIGSLAIMSSVDGAHTMRGVMRYRTGDFVIT